MQSVPSWGLRIGFALLATVAVLGVVARMRLSLRENRRLLEASRRDALTDALTGPPNRRRLNQDLDAAVRAGTEHHLFLIDLDGFKRFNDASGHLAGDQLLIRRAGALTEALDVGAVPYGSGATSSAWWRGPSAAKPW